MPFFSIDFDREPKIILFFVCTNINLPNTLPCSIMCQSQYQRFGSFLFNLAVPDHLDTDQPENKMELKMLKRRINLHRFANDRISKFVRYIVKTLYNECTVQCSF